MKEDLLKPFAEAVGKFFNVTNTPLCDEIVGVNYKYDHVCGKTYGDFHVLLCRIVSQEEAAESMKKAKLH